MTNDPLSPDRVTVPREGRLLGIDFGTKRIGYAISTWEQNIASPLDNYTRRTEKLDREHLLKLVQENRVIALVVGLPLHFGGEEGGKAHEARTFGAWAAKAAGLPIQFHDERCTTAAANDFMATLELTRDKRKALRDKLAAQILLQSFLDGRSPPRRSQDEDELTT